MGKDNIIKILEITKAGIKRRTGIDSFYIARHIASGIIAVTRMLAIMRNYNDIDFVKLVRNKKNCKDKNTICNLRLNVFFNVRREKYIYWHFGSKPKNFPDFSAQELIDKFSKPKQNKSILQESNK